LNPLGYGVRAAVCGFFFFAGHGGDDASTLAGAGATKKIKKTLFFLSF